MSGEALRAALWAVIDHSMPIHAGWCASQEDEAPCICNTGAIMERAYAALAADAEASAAGGAPTVAQAERLVANQIMRAGWARRDEIAVDEARSIVRTVLTGLRWDIDDDQWTPEHHAAAARLAANEQGAAEDGLAATLRQLDEAERRRNPHLIGAAQRAVVDAARESQR